MAVVLGAAFGAVVNSLVKDIVTPLIAMIFGEPGFSALTFTINESQFRYGSFLNAVIAFLIVARGDVLLRRQAREHADGAAQGGRGAAARGRAGGHRAARRDPRTC